MKGNLIVGQSGGPSSVINSSLYGVIEEAKKCHDIDKIIGAVHGIEGILKEDFIDLKSQQQEIIDGLRYTPGAALRGCRHMIESMDVHHEEVKRIFEIFEKYNIRYFVYNGGNDSMDTADKINRLAKEIGYELLVMGVPKTIDNDLVGTHHCPGFGSCAKYLTTLVRESGLHTESMYTSEPITILSTVGRNTGWLPGATALAKENENDAPHLIYMPEVAFNEEQFIKDVKEVYDRVGGVYIVVGQAIVGEDGQYLNVNKNDVATDSFGHPELVGSEIYMKNLIEDKLGIMARIINPGISQQSAMHYASSRDIEEAVLVGREAVKAMMNGMSGYMVTLEVEDSHDYCCKTGFTPLENVANAERKVPREWINETGNFVNEQFINYARELIQGEVCLKTSKGLPEFVRLEKIPIK